LNTVKNNLHPPNPKVCMQVLPSLRVGGLERGACDVAKAANAAGWRSLMVSSGGPAVDEVEKYGVVHFQVPVASKSPFTMICNILRLYQIIRNESVSLVHARSRAPAWSAYFAAKWAGVHFITTFHGVYGFGPFKLKKAYNKIMTFGNVVIGISNFIADHIISNYSLKRETIIVVPRGVDLEYFNPLNVSLSRVQKLKQDWGVFETQNAIMLPARLSDWKGHYLLLEAITVLRDSGDLPEDFVCFMVGPGSSGSSYKDLLNRAIKKRNLVKHVYIIDNCQDIAAAYMIANIVVSASTRPEAFGRVVAEALAMECLVVAPSFGAAPEIINPIEAGFLFKPKDSMSLALCLKSILEMKIIDRSKLLLGARKYIAKSFNNLDMTRETIRIYDQVIS